MSGSPLTADAPLRRSEPPQRAKKRTLRGPARKQAHASPQWRTGDRSISGEALRTAMVGKPVPPKIAIRAPPLPRVPIVLHDGRKTDPPGQLDGFFCGGPWMCRIT
jgi:hypothetical protein